MKDLTAMFAAEKCGDVRTFIQSGNVIFTANPSSAKTLARRISAKIEMEKGYRVPVVLRTAQELEEIVQSNPFVAKGVDEEKLHVLFLDSLPNPSAVKQLDNRRSPPDEFILRGREVFLHLPNGVAHSKLNNKYFDLALKTVSTGRNWRTLNKLQKLAL